MKHLTHFQIVVAWFTYVLFYKVQKNLLWQGEKISNMTT